VPASTRGDSPPTAVGSDDARRVTFGLARSPVTTGQRHLLTVISAGTTAGVSVAANRLHLGLDRFQPRRRLGRQR
jgi:hypothetical protein